MEPTQETTHPITHHNRSHKKSSWLSTPAAVIIGSIIIALSILAGLSMQGGNSSRSGFVDPDSIFSGRELQDEEFLTGKAGADVVFLEYSDLECPFCKHLHVSALNSLMNQYEDKVAFAYRHFPLSFHLRAQAEAEATLCVRDQGGQALYRQYIETIFTITPANDGLDPALLSSEAQKLGINMAVFEECRQSGKYAQYVQDDLADGVMVGVGGTPHSLVLVKDKGGYRILTAISGARDEMYIKKVLDQALSTSEVNNRNFLQKLFD